MTWCRTLTLVFAIIGAWFAVIGTPITRYMILLAAIMSMIWVCWYNYDYNSHDQIKIGRLNLMTWVAWTVGLLAVGMWWFYLAETSGLSFIQRLGITAGLWFIVMLLIEWIGYNVLNIRLKSDYPGLLGLELMHGPAYLKVYYLSAWAVYLFILNQSYPVV